VKDFCAIEVEPMFRESDHIHIIGGGTPFVHPFSFVCLVFAPVLWTRIRKFWLDRNPKKSLDSDTDSDPETVVE
jgi:hypothetical protein